MHKKNSKTRFFNVSYEQLKAFQYDIKKFGLTKTPFEIEYKINSNDLTYKELKKKLASFNRKFIFSGLSGSGKSTLLEIIHQITKIQIMSVDLVVEMEIAKQCKEKNLKNRENFLNWTNQNYSEGYRKWKDEIIISCINTSLENNLYLDLGGNDILFERINQHIKDKQILNIYLHLDFDFWIKKSDFLKKSRSNFNEAWQEDKTLDKSKYNAFCKKFFLERDKKLDVLAHQKITINNIDPIKTLIHILKIINKKEINILTK